MSSGLDKIMIKMSIGEVDEPYNLPVLPDYCSREENHMSLMGRILNPGCQRVTDVVLDMPRKWQLYEKVRGVALSNERFQFIFKEESDLEDIMNKGAHTHNQRSLVLERWVENSPVDYLQYMPVWVRLKNLPVNHQTVRP